MDDADYKRIGDNIKKLREMKGYTQSDFAEILHTNKSKISKIENGNSELKLKLEDAIAIARHFKVTLDELLLGEIPYIEKNKKNKGNPDDLEKLLAIPKSPPPIYYDDYLRYKELYNREFKYGEKDYEGIIKEIKAEKEKLVDKLLEYHYENEDWKSLQFIICINIEHLVIMQSKLAITHQIKTIAQNDKKKEKELWRKIRTYKGFMDFIKVNHDLWGNSNTEYMENEWEYIRDEIGMTWMFLGHLAYYNNALFVYYQVIMYLYDFVNNPFDTGRESFTRYGIELLFLASRMGGITITSLLENTMDLMSFRKVKCDD